MPFIKRLYFLGSDGSLNFSFFFLPLYQNLRFFMKLCARYSGRLNSSYSYLPTFFTAYLKFKNGPGAGEAKGCGAAACS
jgi:hypothetical protein